MCWKHMWGCFLACSSLMFYCKKCVFRLLFTLFVINEYWAHLMFCYEKASGKLFFSLFINYQYCMSKMFYYEFYKTFPKWMLFKLLLNSLFRTLYKLSVNSCLLVYSSKFAKPLWTAAFGLFIKDYKNSVNNCFFCYSFNIIEPMWMVS